MNYISYFLVLIIAGINAVHINAAQSDDITAQCSAVTSIGAPCSFKRCSVLLDMCRTSGRAMFTEPSEHAMGSYMLRKQTGSSDCTRRAVADYMSEHDIRLAQKECCFDRIYNRRHYGSATKYTNSEACGVFSVPLGVLGLCACCGQYGAAIEEYVKSLPGEMVGNFALPALSCCIVSPWLFYEVTKNVCLCSHGCLELCCMEVKHGAQTSKED